MSVRAGQRRAPGRSGRTPISLGLVALAMLLSAAEAAPSGPRPAAQQTLSAYGHLPLNFVANLGQTDPRAAFVAHGRGYTLFVSPTETVFVAQSPAPPGQALASRLRALRGPAASGDRGLEGSARCGRPHALARCGCVGGHDRRGADIERQLSHRQRSIEVAHQCPRVRPGAVPRRLPWRRPRLLRQRAPVRVRLRRRGRCRSARDPARLRRRLARESEARRPTSTPTAIWSFAPPTATCACEGRSPTRRSTASAIRWRPAMLCARRRRPAWRLGPRSVSTSRRTTRAGRW